MKKKECIICIPVFRGMSDNERHSLRQCLRVLGSHPMTFVAPLQLDCSDYETECSLCGVTFSKITFDDEFFNGIAGYNRLLLSERFYGAFRQYDYVLIYQLDAFVFKDELENWCSKGYDFVGAPLFGQFEDVGFHPKQSRVGNGGFSLRRVQAYLDFFQGKKRVFKTKDIANRIALWEKPYTRCLVWLLMAMGWRNKPHSVAQRWKYNEDDFWSGMLDGSNYELYKPTTLEALDFAFERFPSECYKLTGKLPFGCHAWEKYQYETFWKDKISLSE